MAQSGVEEHEGIEVGVKGREMLRFVQGMEVIDISGDFHLAPQSPIFDDRAEGILGRPWR